MRFKNRKETEKEIEKYIEKEIEKEVIYSRLTCEVETASRYCTPQESRKEAPKEV